MRALILAVVLLLLPAAVHAQASERKVALVIANGSYCAAGVLANPANDARLVGGAARRAGFEVVSAQNADLANFQRALRDFRTKADGARVAMVYYAGHGIEGSGKNWLIPVDAKLESGLDLPYEAVELDRVMDSMSGAQVRMVVLGACRNNPFGRSWKSATRAVQRGLAGIEFDNVLVIYAAAPGQTASDGAGANSPFAISFAKRLGEADLPIQLLGGMIRDDVLAATGRSQRPYTTGSITGTPIYLVRREATIDTTKANAAIEISEEFPPTPKLSEAAATAASGEAVWVQVGAYTSVVDAEMRWSTLSRDYNYLSGLKHRLIEAQADTGRVFRLQITAGDTRSVYSLCVMLRAKGLGCAVVG